MYNHEEYVNRNRNKKVETKKFWEPEEGVCWNISEGGVDRCYVDVSEIRVGDVFQTEEGAEKELTLRQAIYRLRKAFFEVSNGENGWLQCENNHQVFILVDVLDTATHNVCKYQPSWMYVRTKEQAESLIETHKNDLMLVLGN